MIAASIRLALAALLRNKLRSALTMLGVIIGVAAVVMMQSMGGGATAYVSELISGLGSNMLFVIPGAGHGFGGMTSGAPLFTVGDLEAIRHEAHDVALASAVGTRPERVVYGGRNRSTQVTGAMPAYFEIRNWGAASGRLFTEEEERAGASVCVVGQTLVDDVFLGQSPLGKELRVRDKTFRVIGVLEAKGGAMGMDQDDVVLMPFSAFQERLVGSDRIGAIFASAQSPDRIEDAKNEIVAILRRRRHIAPGNDDDFSVRDPRDIQAVLGSVMGVLTTLLAGVAAISLVVGGIGIMNIMLVSVTERTREIGVRLAIGARARDILTQFLVEATTLSTLGGLVGIALGLGGALGVAGIIHVPFVVPGVSTPVAFGVSVLLGVVFGVWPARKAARLHPLEALRFE